MVMVMLGVACAHLTQFIILDITACTTQALELHWHALGSWVVAEGSLLNSEQLDWHGVPVTPRPTSGTAWPGEYASCSLHRS